MKKIDLTDELIEEAKNKLKLNHKDSFKFISNLYQNQSKESNRVLSIQLAICYASAIGLNSRDYKKSLSVLEELLKNEKLLESDYLLKGKIYHKIGVYNHYLGNYLDSFISYNKAIDSFAIISSDNIEAELNLANSMQNIGILHKLNNFIEFDKKNIDKAVNIYTKLNEISGLASCYDLYAAYFQNLKNYSKANSYLLKSLEIAKQLNDIKYIAICYNNLASSYASLDDFEKAYEYHQKSYKLRKKINDPYQIAIHYMHLALTHVLNKLYRKSIYANKKAESFLTQYGYKAELSSIYEGLSESYMKLKMHKQANEYLLKYSEIQKEMFKFDKASALHNSQLSYSLIEKEKEAKALRLKNKEFEIINEELKQFAYIASHDLKEPVRSLNNYVQLLKRSLKEHINTEQEEFINYIEIFSNRIFGLIKDLNQYTQIQEPIETQHIDLNVCIKIVMDSLTLYIREHNAIIKTQKLPMIKASHSHMHDLFLNLIQNAIKYNTQSIPKITINSIENKKDFIISIKDNGIGIPKKNQSEIFEVFKRLHAKTEYEGTGIGLAICKKIVDQNNGRIWVESELGKGSTFYISFPK